MIKKEREIWREICTDLYDLQSRMNTAVEKTNELGERWRDFQQKIKQRKLKSLIEFLRIDLNWFGGGISLMEMGFITNIRKITIEMDKIITQIEKKDTGFTEEKNKIKRGRK